MNTSRPSFAAANQYEVGLWGLVDVFVTLTRVTNERVV